MRPHSRCLPRLAASLLALLVGASSVAAQDWKGLGRLAGKVADDAGAPLEGVSVKLDLPERGGGTTITTDKKGRWALLGVAAGSWNIDFSLAGYAPKAITVQLPSESARIPSIDVKLEKAGPTGASPDLAKVAAEADAAYKAGRWSDARAEYEKVLAQKPDLAGLAEQQIGFTYIQEKRFPDAVDHLEKAVAADPSNQSLRAIAAQAALEGKLIDRARALLTGLDRSKITQPDVFYNMAVNFLNGGDAASAIEYFGEAIRVDPTHVEAHYRRGLGYLGQGKNAEAKADFQKVLELSPQGPMADMARKALALIP
jgi:tetratricopeptide (TPR) repeat protein